MIAALSSSATLAYLSSISFLTSDNLSKRERITLTRRSKIVKPRRPIHNTGLSRFGIREKTCNKETTSQKACEWAARRKRMRLWRPCQRDPRHHRSAEDLHIQKKHPRCEEHCQIQYEREPTTRNIVRYSKRGSPPPRRRNASTSRSVS